LSLKSIQNFFRSYPEIKKACDALRSDAISDLLESSLIRRAVGYTETEIEEQYVDDDSGKLKKVTTRTRHMPPDIAAIKVLANKYAKHLLDPDKQQTNIRISLTSSKALSLEERRRIIQDDARPAVSRRLPNNGHLEHFQPPVIADCPKNPSGADRVIFEKNSESLLSTEEPRVIFEKNTDSLLSTETTIDIGSTQSTKSDEEEIDI
jgi:hypothetical protein